ncbi:hypothetical protein GCM10011414_21990 [Croceivirga lutea]|nr:hypothetical protein GCM10011414_21990 [Croceivirga lutea]
MKVGQWLGKFGTLTLCINSSAKLFDYFKTALKTILFTKIIYANCVQKDHIFLDNTKIFVEM